MIYLPVQLPITFCQRIWRQPN